MQNWLARYIGGKPTLEKPTFQYRRRETRRRREGRNKACRVEVAALRRRVSREHSRRHSAVATTPSSPAPAWACSRRGNPTTSPPFIRQVGPALGVSAFVFVAGRRPISHRSALLIAVSAGAFACIMALPAHSLRGAHEVNAIE
jgi:hypothetical protein